MTPAKLLTALLHQEIEILLIVIVYYFLIFLLDS